jgi:hypothetical protein
MGRIEVIDLIVRGYLSQPYTIENGIILVAQCTTGARSVVCSRIIVTVTASVLDERHSLERTLAMK